MIRNKRALSQDIDDGPEFRVMPLQNTVTTAPLTPNFRPSTMTVQPTSAAKNAQNGVMIVWLLVISLAVYAITRRK